jgi:hypothetical protein
MSQLVSAALTVTIGVLVFIAGQGLQHFLLDPVQEQRKTIGEVAFALLMFANVADVAAIRAEGLPVLELIDPTEVIRTLRTLAARLQQSLYVIPAYRFLAVLHVVPRQPRILKAMASLVAWSNMVHSGQPGAAQDAVATAPLGVTRNR